jgi:eukaryotic-like serine/threonine-protein kinase
MKRRGDEETPEQRRKRLIARGKRQMKAFRWDEGVECLREAAQIAEDHNLGPRSIAATYMHLARACDEARLPLESDHALAEARQALERLHGRESEGVLGWLIDTGVSLAEGKDTAAAELYFREAVELADAHPDYSRETRRSSVHDLAALLLQERRPAEAVPLFERSLEMGEASYGPEDERILYDLMGLAEALLGVGRAEEALSVARRCIVLCEATTADDAVLAPLTRLLGRILADLGQWEEAIANLQRSRAIWEAHLTLPHPVMSACDEYLAEAYEGGGSVVEAQRLYAAAIANLERTLGFGGDHHSLRHPLLKLAALLRRQGRDDEAAILEARAARIEPPPWEMETS